MYIGRLHVAFTSPGALGTTEIQMIVGVSNNLHVFVDRAGSPTARAMLKKHLPEGHEIKCEYLLAWRTDDAGMIGEEADEVKVLRGTPNIHVGVNTRVTYL